MKEQIYTRPLVPLYLHEFTEAILDVIPGGKDMLPIHHGKVSLICNPHDIKGLFPEKPMGDFAFEGSLDLILVSGPPERQMIAAFDLPRGRSARFDREKRLFFDEVGIFYFSTQKSEWREALPRLLDEFLAFPRGGDENESIINPAQWDVMSRLADKAKDLGLHLLHEVSLDSVIAISTGSIDLSDELTPLVVNQHYLRQTSFDAVITTPPPNCKPVCAIEFDGRVHDDPEKRLKDEKKNQACHEARLPLIRIPSVDVKAAQLGRKVIDVREQRQMKRAEVSWLVVEELLKALAKEHFSSTWYLSQLHHFICLEADAISDLDPDSSATLRDYAGELWRLSEGRISQLESKIAEIGSEAADRSTWDEWLAAYHTTEYDAANEELMRIGDRTFEFQRRIEKEYLDVATDGCAGIKLVSMEFKKYPDSSRHGSSRYSVKIQGSELLSSLGVLIKPRLIELGPIGVSVSGNRLGVTSKLIDEVAVQYLRRSAQDIVESYKSDILNAVEHGEESLWQFVAAEVWPRVPIRLVEMEISGLLKAAVKSTETDFSKLTANNLDDYFDFKAGSLPSKSVPLSERERRLGIAASRCRAVLDAGSFEANQKVALHELVDSLEGKLRDELSSADS